MAPVFPSHRPHVPGLAVGLSLFIAGFASHSIQTTSGKDYLEKHRAASSSVERTGSAAKGATGFNEALHQAAAIEPTLSFPARIGIAKTGCIERYRCGVVVPLRPKEAEAWSEIATNLWASYGSIVPLNPLLLKSAHSEAASAGMTREITTLEKVRLTAARQHLDVIIAYEAQSRGQREANVLAVGDLTIIGAFVMPSRKIEIEATVALAAETEEAVRSLRQALAEQQ